MRAPRVPAVDRAARLLQALAEGEWRLTDLARGLGTPKSTTLAILRTLRHHQLVGLEPRSGRYRLGPALLRLAAAARARADLREVARPVLGRLMRATGETAILHVPDGAGYLILDREESPHQLRVTAPVGFRLPPFAGAVAKAVLAAGPPREAARIVARARLPRFTPRSLTSRRAYLNALEDVRRRGVATDDEEYLPGVRAASAAVIGPQGDVLGTVSVVGVKDRLPETKLRTAARIVGLAAREVSGLPGSGV